MRISGQSILSSGPAAAMKNGMDPAAFQGLNPGGAEGAIGYCVPNVLVDHAMRNPHVPPGFWRGVNNNQNAIYSNASWTNSRMRPARIRSNSAAS